MGAHKQKWTSEEEAALKAGVVKHGAGKWRTILVDPEFEDTLRLRSNVDLKDKWRNINVSEVYGSRQKAKKAPNSKRLMALKVDKNHLAVTTVQHEEDELDAKPLAISCGTLQSSNSKGQISRLNNQIIEAIVHLKEPNGSNKEDIASYIEDKYHSSSNLRNLLSTELKHMVETGKLIKEKHKYRLIPSSRTSEKRIRLDRRAKNSLEAKKCNDYRIPSKSQNDREPQKTKHMTMKKAAVIEAIKAVAVAEIACAEAEKAAMLADEIEAEAEASVSLHKKLMKELENKTFRINLL